MSARGGVALGAALALLVAAGATRAETLDEVVGRHVEALGGAARWAEVQDVEITGDYESFSTTAPFRLLKQRPGRYRFEHKNNLKDAVYGHDGTTAWWVSQMFLGWPTVMPPAQRVVAETDAEIESPLIGWREKGHRLELVGREEIDGVDTVHLKLIRASGVEESFWLDGASGLPERRTAPASDFGQPLVRTIFYDDWRLVDGLRFPFLVEEEYGIRHFAYHVASVRLGRPADEALFRMPPPDGMERFLKLEGDWNVAVSSSDGPGGPWKEGRTTSHIEAPVRGGILLERITHEIEGDRSEIVRTLSWDRFRGRYRATWYDNATLYQSVLEGVFDADGRLVLSNVETNTGYTILDFKISARLVYHEIGPDGFKLDVEASYDGGKNFTPTVKYVYTR